MAMNSGTNRENEKNEEANSGNNNGHKHHKASTKSIEVVRKETVSSLIHQHHDTIKYCSPGKPPRAQTIVSHKKKYAQYNLTRCA